MNIEDLSKLILDSLQSLKIVNVTIAYKRVVAIKTDLMAEIPGITDPNIQVVASMLLDFLTSLEVKHTKEGYMDIMQSLNTFKQYITTMTPGEDITTLAELMAAIVELTETRQMRESYLALIKIEDALKKELNIVTFVFDRDIYGTSSEPRMNSVKELDMKKFEFETTELANRRDTLEVLDKEDNEVLDSVGFEIVDSPEEEVVDNENEPESVEKDEKE